MHVIPKPLKVVYLDVLSVCMLDILAYMICTVCKFVSAASAAPLCDWIPWREVGSFKFPRKDLGGWQTTTTRTKAMFNQLQWSFAWAIPYFIKWAAVLEDHNGNRVHCQNYTTYSTQPHEPLSAGPLKLPYMRPPPECRTFRSEEVEVAIGS